MGCGHGQWLWVLTLARHHSLRVALGQQPRVAVEAGLLHFRRDAQRGEGRIIAAAETPGRGKKPQRELGAAPSSSLLAPKAAGPFFLPGCSVRTQSGHQVWGLGMSPWWPRSVVLVTHTWFGAGAPGQSHNAWTEVEGMGPEGYRDQSRRLSQEIMAQGLGLFPTPACHVPAQLLCHIPVQPKATTPTATRLMA